MEWAIEAAKNHIPLLMIIGVAGIAMWKINWSRTVFKKECEGIREICQKGLIEKLTAIEKKEDQRWWQFGKDLSEMKSDIRNLTDHMLNGKK